MRHDFYDLLSKEGPRAGRKRSLLSVDSWTDDIASVVRYALTTTRATAICPFHDNVTIRVGDDAAETHAYVRATKVVKSDGTSWKREALSEELERQLVEAADRVCPQCTAPIDPRC